MHHYPFHVGDYLLDTVHLPPMADLVYRRLLDLYYMQESPIPNKPKWVATRIRLPDQDGLVLDVLRSFFTLEGAGKDSCWRQKRADAVISKYQKKAAVAVENGKKHIAGTKKEPKSDAAGLQPITRTRTTISPIPPEGVEVFEKFWKPYPKKASKPDAERAFAKAMGWLPKHKARATIEQIVEGLAWHLTCAQWVKDGGGFIPHPASWLNADGWNDRPLQPEPGEAPKQWHETLAGVQAKAAEMGLPAQRADEQSMAFMLRVKRAADELDGDSGGGNG